MLRLEARPQPSKWMSMASPLLALVITVLVGVVMFALLGKDPLRALQMFFYEPIKSAYAWTEIAVKATPLVLIGLGLAICYRSNVWNIGAEGQYVIGAVFASGVAMQAGADTPRAIVLVILLAGIVGGMVWAGIVALLRDRFNANEILVSLMLVYVAVMVLSYLVYGPWKDPKGYNFPQTITFAATTKVPRLIEGFRLNIGVLIALADGGAGVVVPVSHLPRLRAAGGRPGTRRGALRGLLVAPRVVDGAADLGRPGRPGRCARGRGAARATDAVRAGGLRLRRHHRGLRRPPASGGRGVRRHPDEHVLHRRRVGAVAAGAAEVADRRVPGAAAVRAAGVRHVDPLSRPLAGCGSGARRCCGGAGRPPAAKEA